MCASRRSAPAGRAADVRMRELVVAEGRINEETEPATISPPTYMLLRVLPELRGDGETPVESDPATAPYPNQSGAKPNPISVPLPRPHPTSPIALPPSY
jgi:hypothetical protein